MGESNVVMISENATSLQTTMSECMKKIEDLKKEMDAKDKEVDKLKKQVENINKLEQDKIKLLKEVRPVKNTTHELDQIVKMVIKLKLFFRLAIRQRR